MEPFVGEIRPFPFTFAPLGWLYCDGSLVAISNYDVLYNLIGTTYGGDGVTTFALPDLRGRVPMHQGQGSGTGPATVIGQPGGAETITLIGAEVPPHTHPLSAGGPGTSANPVGTYPAIDATQVYGSATGALGPTAIAPNSGGGSPHDNVQPYLTIAYCIAFQGVYPTQG